MCSTDLDWARLILARLTRPSGGDWRDFTLFRVSLATHHKRACSRGRNGGGEARSPSLCGQHASRSLTPRWPRQVGWQTPDTEGEGMTRLHGKAVGTDGWALQCIQTPTRVATTYNLKGGERTSRYSHVIHQTPFSKTLFEP